MKKLTCMIVLIILVLTFQICFAELIDRGGGLIYDSYSNLTWLQNPRHLSSSSWGGSVNLAAKLVYYDSERDVTWDDWRLPHTGEIRDLYTRALGNKIHPADGWGLKNKGSFNLYYSSPTDAAYWTQDPKIGDSTGAYCFSIYHGKTSGIWRGYTFHTWPVREGDVGPANVIPVAKAGEDLFVRPGVFITLSGGASYDHNEDYPLEYYWNIKSKPSGSLTLLSEPHSDRPSIIPDKLGNYIIELIVVDSKGYESLPHQVVINSNLPLIDRGRGLIYDPAADLTWLQDPRHLGSYEWGGSVYQAGNFSFYDSERDVTWDDWRLPHTGEIRDLYTRALGNKIHPADGWGLKNKGSFNLYYSSPTDAAYWTQDPKIGDSTGAYCFSIYHGKTSGIWRGYTFHTWPVREGDVGLPQEDFGLIAYYAFDGDASDASGNGNDGTTYGGVTYHSGLNGQAASFDGLDDYISLNTSSLISTGSVRTISFWIKTDRTDTHSHIISNRGDKYSIDINIHKVDHILEYHMYDGFQPDWYRGTTYLPDGQWHHIAVLKYVKEIEIYIDGKSEGRNTLLSVADCDENTFLEIGRTQRDGEDSYEGLIDEMRIFNRILSEKEILALFEKVPSNQPPDLEFIGNKTVNEGKLLEFTITATDLDKDPLTYSVNGLPSGANFDTSTATFSWIPDYNQAGTYFGVNFKVFDGSDSDSEFIMITVNNTNQPPVANTISEITPEDLSCTIELTGADPDKDSLIYLVASQPSHGILSGAIPSLTYTPATNFYGTDSFTFKANDGSLDSNVATVNITVNPVNDPPSIGAIGAKTINEGASLIILVTGSDPDGDVLEYSVSTNLPKGASFNPTWKTLTWTPEFDQAGSYEVTFQVRDAEFTVSETITITVINVNRPPEFVEFVISPVLEGETLTLFVEATDPDEEDTLTYGAEKLPEGATFETGNFSWTPNNTQAGNFPVTFYATDNGQPNKKTSLSVDITVIDVPPAEWTEKLIEIIEDMEFPKAVKNSYMANMKSVKDFIESGQITAAINQVSAFIKKVEKDIQKGKISSEEGQILIEKANQLIADLS